MDVPLSGVGPKKITYKCKLPYFNHVKLRLVAFLRDENQENLAILSTTNPPVFSIDRVVDRTNRSELDSSTGLLSVKASGNNFFGVGYENFICISCWSHV